MNQAMAIAILFVGVISEVFGDSMMKYSNGFKKKWPILGIIAGYLISFYLMSVVVQYLPLGFTYAFWTGLGIALTAFVGIIFWKEPINAKKILGVALIVAGVVLMKIGGE